MQALCWVCSKSGLGRDRYAAGLGSLALRNILRHPKSKTHGEAIRLWIEQAKGSAGDSSKPVEPAVALQPPTVTLTKPQQSFEAAQFLFLRTMLETQGAFNEYVSWAAAASAVGGTGSQSKWGPKDCKCALVSMASFEHVVTSKLFKAGDGFWLQADGLSRTYQVGMGGVLWKFPSGLPWLLQPGTQHSWLQCLGERGPWLVERLVGAREFPADMDMPSKVQMLREGVRRVTKTPSGEVDLELYAKVSSRMLCWASDGADRSVGAAATEYFPSMVFQVWEESHSAVKVLKHAVAADAEICLVDSLLVSGKEPPSLANFLSTSDVFRRRCGDAQQMASGIPLCLNFGWAPQRYASRARPLAREARRWEAIWDSLAEEAGSASVAKRRAIAQHFLRELGGQNAPRLLLGGMLTDISVEHYEWVAGGDKADPDPSTAAERAELFLHRLEVLFGQGLILTLPDTYTGEVLRFLRRGKIVHYGNQVELSHKIM